MIQILQVRMFGFEKILTPNDPKRYGYQTSRQLFFMWVWALTKLERIGDALVIDAIGA